MTWESGFVYNQLSIGMKQCICKDVLRETPFLLIFQLFAVLGLLKSVSIAVLNLFKSTKPRLIAHVFNKNFQQLCSDIFAK